MIACKSLLPALLLLGAMPATAEAPAPAPAAEASPATEDQQVLASFSQPLPIAGGPLWVTLLTARSAEALWRDDPALGTLRMEIANAGTAFYVAGIATRPTRFTPSAVAIQAGRRIPGKIVNMAHMNGIDVPEGATMLALVEFDEALKLDAPFALELGGTRIDFSIAGDALARWGAAPSREGRGF